MNKTSQEGYKNQSNATPGMYLKLHLLYIAKVKRIAATFKHREVLGVSFIAEFLNRGREPVPNIEQT